MQTLDSNLLLWCPKCHFAQPDTPVCSICLTPGPLPWPDGLPVTLEQRLVAAGRLSDAYAALSDRVSSGHQDAPTCLALAWLAYAFQDLRAVEIWCHECARLEPASPGPHIVLGHVFERSGRFEEAVAEYQAALARPTLEPPSRLAVEAALQSARDRIPEF